MVIGVLERALGPTTAILPAPRGDNAPSFTNNSAPFGRCCLNGDIFFRATTAQQTCYFHHCRAERTAVCFDLVRSGGMCCVRVQCMAARYKVFTLLA